jgi:aspartyl/asparaginyl beta-hydroxylase (cupin superfamily)
VPVEPLAFFDPAQFPWTQKFEHAHEQVNAEVQRQLRMMTPHYQGYLETAGGQPTNKRKWFGRTILFFTIKNETALANMPITCRLLGEIPNLVSAILLRMEGDTHLKPHGGFSPDTLRCHFGVTVPEPEACSIRVANEIRNWQEGEWLIFDDYLEHEAWHRGTLPRTVLSIDIVRPGVAHSPTAIAEQFFNKRPGIRYEDYLDQVATPDVWLRWLEAGRFPSD